MADLGKLPLDDFISAVVGNQVLRKKGEEEWDKTVPAMDMLENGFSFWRKIKLGSAVRVKLKYGLGLVVEARKIFISSCQVISGILPY